MTNSYPEPDDEETIIRVPAADGPVEVDDDETIVRPASRPTAHSADGDDNERTTVVDRSDDDDRTTVVERSDLERSDVDERTTIVDRGDPDERTTVVDRGDPDDRTTIVDRGEATDDGTVVVGRGKPVVRKPSASDAALPSRRSKRRITLPPVEPGFGREAVEAAGPGAISTYEPRLVPEPPTAPAAVDLGPDATRADAPSMPSVSRRSRRLGLIGLVGFAAACVLSVVGLGIIVAVLLG